MPDLLGHLHEVVVEGLFGNRRIAFELSDKEPTILTGRNGTGKSTILRIINSIGTGAWFELPNLPFHMTRLNFESGSSLEVRREEDETLVGLDGEEWRFSTETYAEFEFDDEHIFHVPGVRQVGHDRFEYQGRIFGRKALVHSLRTEAIVPSEVDWVKNLPERLPILFVTDQRLVVSEDRGRHRPRLTPRRTAVEHAAHDLSRQMASALSEYANRSQLLDRDFPYRVVEAMGSNVEIDDAELSTLLEEIAAERRALQEVGLLPKDLAPEPFRQLPLANENVQPVIKTFLEDTKQKFEALADLRNRLTIFTDFLNQHYDSKQVIPQPRHGFSIILDESEDTPLPPADLSSGEQQILVLAYEILFRAEPGTLILIDEPELSLHVLWQDTFIEDLTRMGSARDLQFLLATHSPTLVGAREDLRRSLDQVSST